MARFELTLYNTLTRREEPVQPLEPGRVRMYHCGPTVYNYPHIGNLSAFMLGDVVRRALEYAGHEVIQVMNITDVGHLTVDDVADAQGEDKLEAAARTLKKTPWDLARHYTQAFFADLEALNMRAAHYYPRASEFVPEMIALVEKLEKKGLAYRVGGDVYFEVARFPGYGRLSGNTLEKLEAGARIDVREEKRSPHDFALWKTDPKHVMQWDSPFGRGFPGWHIECSAMSMRFLGETFDIHTGGEDNIFPHHECEIAQSEGASGKPFVKHWLHARFLLVDGKKMAKSAGNFYTLRDVVARGYSGREVRYLLISTHYRSQANFTFEALDAARNALARLDNFTAKVEAEARLWQASAQEFVPGESTAAADLRFIREAAQKFDQALAADLNVSAALAAIMELVREGNRRELRPAEAAEALAFLRDVDEVLGVLFWKPNRSQKGRPAAGSNASRAYQDEDQHDDSSHSPGVIEDSGAPGLHEAAAQALLEKREAARKAKNFAESDRLREELKALGWVIEDTPKGPWVKRIS